MAGELGIIASDDSQQLPTFNDNLDLDKSSQKSKQIIQAQNVVIQHPK